MLTFTSLEPMRGTHDINLMLHGVVDGHIRPALRHWPVPVSVNTYCNWRANRAQPAL